jgi:hypothetical protein
MEALSSSETSVLIRATRHNISEDAFFIVTAVKTPNLTKFMAFFQLFLRKIKLKVGHEFVIYARKEIYDE